MADVDIVIVNWNSGGQLAECLSSINLLRPNPVYRISKCTVVDNASIDGSAQGLGAFPFDLAVINNTENKGFGAACNEGAAAGHADYILFLNPDVKLFPDTLNEAVAFMAGNGQEQVGILGVQYVDGECHVQVSAGRFPTPAGMLYEMLGLDRLWPGRFPPSVMTDWDHLQSREVDVLQGAFLLIRRAVFEQLHGFDERFFMYYEDVDLAYRARHAGWQSYYLAESKVYHRGGGATDQIKAKRLAYWFSSRTRYVAKHFGAMTAASIAIASFTLELATRLIWTVLHLSRGHLPETLRAYAEYGRELPRSLRR